MYRQMMMSQAKRVARMPSVRGYASSTGDFSKGMMERAQSIGSSIARTAERALGKYAEPVTYNLKVAGALAKQVYVTEKLAPPTSLHQITSAYRQIWSCVSNMSWWTHALPGGEWKKVAVYGVEAVGIFAIGEIVRANMRCTN